MHTFKIGIYPPAILPSERFSFLTFFFLFFSGSKFDLLGPFPNDACLRVINVRVC